MAVVRWSKLFTRRYPVKGATEPELRSLVSSLATPLTEEEAEAINASQSNPFPSSDPSHLIYKPFDPRKWLFPTTSLPDSYLDFLGWSNGGSFFTGDRCFDPLIACNEVRNHLLGYHVPQYMPGAIPFAFDGGGRFYLFDMRREPIAGEYPILFVGSGNLCYADAVHVAASFIDACKGTSDPSERSS
jgi:hypothetical protein